ncbi:exodeoxyribonuclease V subunit gamma [Cyanobium sp. FGCU-6]|nr:exodeoxyribonuclease V subunit gamma [Cyanobium sp. FGCU6]
MLTVYRSNRAELLAQVLAADLTLNPPGPFEQVAVVVNTWPTSRWLGEQLALHLGGIAANLRFPFPGSLLRSLVDRVLAEPGGAAESGAEDPWRAERLVWAVLRQLPQLAGQPDGEPLRTWLGERDLERRLELAGWQLGRAIADAFDDYGLYRPALLQAWDAGACCDERGRPLPASQRWQPLLYAALRRQLEREPFGLRVGRAIDRLRDSSPIHGIDGGHLRLFGLSSLAPVQVQLLQALSGRMRIDLHLLTPCRDLWQRCEDRRRRLSDALALELPFDADWLLEAPGLDARFGRLGSEFQQLLEGDGETQLGTAREGDLFFLPATVARRRRPDRPPPLLAQLQEQLLEARGDEPLELGEGDDSLEFHACPGDLRQVQIVRDRLLQLLAADSSLQPRHLLVMTPDVERFAPLVAAVFGDAGATGVELPWRLTDRSQQNQAGIGRTLLALLRLGGERLTASALEALLECQPLQQHFALTAAEASRLSPWLQTCGFRWGLDAGERGGDPTHSLDWAIDRLLLGLVLPDRPGLAPSDTAPAPPLADLDLLGRWLQLLLRLRHWLHDLRRPRPCPAWEPLLAALLDDLFGDGGDSAWELAPIRRALAASFEAAGPDETRLLEAPVLAAVLDEGLAVDSGRFGHRSGALTVSALEPMRAIPHRVIVLMGLDAGHFPRQRPRPGFHRLEQQRRLGDPHPADQDRYALLEALLSARDHLLLTWSCRDDRKGEELPPAAPVRQWLQWLEQGLGPGAGPLVRRHAASPLAPANFLPDAGRPPASCDRRLLATRRLLDGELPPPANGLRWTAQPVRVGEAGGEAGDRGGTLAYEDLQAWLKAPQEHWLRQLGLRPAEWDTIVEDLEALALGERERAALLRRALRDTPPADALLTPDWRGDGRGRGLLPPGSAAVLEARGLECRWLSLQTTLAGLGPVRGETLCWGGLEATVERRGDAVVVVKAGRGRVPEKLELWLSLLLAVAATPPDAPPPARGVLVARQEKDKDLFGDVLTLMAPEREAAASRLAHLLDLRARWRQDCWPVPPATGWAWLEAERRKLGSGLEKAREAWEGSESDWSFPEQEKPEMLVCFGADLPLETLLDDTFKALAEELFAPLMDAVQASSPQQRR